MIFSMLVLAYLAGFVSPFVWFAVDWQRGKRRKMRAGDFFGERS